MPEIAIACVRSGTRYGIEYVQRLYAMVERNLGVPHSFVCFTDQPERCDGVDFYDASSTELTGWWLKMALFRRGWRVGRRVVYLDLDTVIINDLRPLVEVDVDFAISKNFARMYGAKSWPCNYGSCAMVFGENFGEDVWNKFCERRGELMLSCETTGDQMAIEKLSPHAPFLQDFLPKDFLLNHRVVGPDRPKKASVIVFGGKVKPHNSPIGWIGDAWTAA